MLVKPEITQQLGQAASAELGKRRLEPFCELVDPRYESKAFRRKIIEHLEALESRQIDRLMVFIRSQVGKSYLCSQMFPAWYLGRHPDHSVMLCSYSLELAKKNSGGVQRAFLARDWPFETHISQRQSALDYWQTSRGGELIAAGVEGRLTGFGSTLAIIDDPVADRLAAASETQRETVWSWYTDVFKTRLRSDSAVALTMTRWSDDDLAARILDSPEGKRWSVLRIPAYSEGEDDPLGRPLGEPLDCDTEMPLPDERNTRTFHAMYQQSPVPYSGYTFQKEWLEHRYDWIPIHEWAHYFTLSIDSSWGSGVKSDFSVLQVWFHDFKNFFLVDQWRDRVEYPQLRQVVLDFYHKYNPTSVLIEKAASGFALSQEFKQETGLPVFDVIPRGSKEARAELTTHWFETGRVLLPRKAPWLDGYINEMLRFPAGKHDDQVDATTQAISVMAEEARRRSAHAKWKTHTDDVVRGIYAWRTSR